MLISIKDFWLCLLLTVDAFSSSIEVSATASSVADVTDFKHCE